MVSTLRCPIGDCDYFTLDELDTHVTERHHLPVMCTKCTMSFINDDAGAVHVLNCEEEARIHDDFQVRNARVVDTLIKALEDAESNIREADGAIMDILGKLRAGEDEKLVAAVQSLVVTNTIQKEYDELKKIYDAGDKSIDVLLRLANFCNEIGNRVEKNKRQGIIVEGKKYATEAWNTDSNNFLAARSAALMSEKVAVYLRGTEQIEEMKRCIMYLYQALTLQQGDADTLVIRGKWTLSAANLTSSDRLHAAIDYVTSAAALEDAFVLFQEANNIKPSIENAVYLGRTLHRKFDKELAKLAFGEALNTEPSNISIK